MTTFLVAIEVEDWLTEPSARDYLADSLEYMQEVADGDRRIKAVRMLPEWEGAPSKPTTQIDLATECLKAARDLLKAAGARKTLERVRLALTSAGGARRHAELAPYRAERQAGA